MGQWGTVPSGTALYFPQASASVFKHCANAALVMTHKVLSMIQRQEIDMNIVAYSIQ